MYATDVFSSVKRGLLMIAGTNNALKQSKPGENMLGEKLIKWKKKNNKMKR